MRIGARETIELAEMEMRSDARKAEDSHKTSRFSMRFSRATKRIYGATTAVAIVMGLFFQLWQPSGDDSLPIAIMLYVIAAVALFPFLYSISYRCDVDEARIVRKEFWIFTKTVEWKRVKYKRSRMHSPYDKDELILLDARKKRLIDFSANMVGFSNLDRLAKRKNIPAINPKRHRPKKQGR